ncbi:gastric triacylglycerol lipase-like [Panonychus citri]|uniref:gastric triacylglycerol lipase-like n=1 Tax=Panonychus citri TaxID=50023 RepID=UPI0023078CB2|nr:gastric triacylglycerol lipase-like [Panonychus citri]
MSLINFTNLLIVLIVVQLTINNCLDLDEVDKKNIPDIIEARGFICETHYITTSDGYILGNYRIVNPLMPKSFAYPQLKPIILQSGFLGSGVDFIIASPRGFVNQSIALNANELDLIDFDLDGRNLGFILANLGYDVWLTNPRGNFYSTNHTTLDPESREFWSFSLDQMANIDLPAMVDYVLQVTGRETIGYIGFSRGSLVMFGLLADQPNYSKKINPFVSIAPPIFLKNFDSPFRILACSELVAKFIRDHPRSCFPRSILRLEGICSYILIKPLCDMIRLNLLSLDVYTANSSRLEIYFSHLPAGSSCWDFVHFAQRITNNHFMHLDFGSDYNLKHYGSEKPPIYNLLNVNSTNIMIIQSTGDKTTNPTDVQHLIDELPVPPIERVKIEDENFSHLDFLFNNNAGLLVNRPIAEFLANNL